MKVFNNNISFDDWKKLVDGSAVLENRETDFCTKNDVRKYFDAGWTPQRVFFACEAGVVPDDEEISDEKTV